MSALAACRHYSVDLVALPDWDSDVNVDAVDYRGLANTVDIQPGTQQIQIGAHAYSSDIAMIFQASSLQGWPL